MSGPPNVVLFTLSTCPACAELKTRLSALPAPVQGTVYIEEDNIEAMNKRGIENVPAMVLSESGETMTPEQTWQHVAALEQMVQDGHAGSQQRRAAPSDGKSAFQRVINVATSDPRVLIAAAALGYLAYRRYYGAPGVAPGAMEIA